MESVSLSVTNLILYMETRNFRRNIGAEFSDYSTSRLEHSFLLLGYIVGLSFVLLYFQSCYIVPEYEVCNNKKSVDSVSGIGFIVAKFTVNRVC
jgi:hypothetical protein